MFKKIGGLFHEGDIDQELAFRYAVEKINLDKTVLPRSKLSAQIERVPSEDSFHASKRGYYLVNFMCSIFISFYYYWKFYGIFLKSLIYILVCHLLRMGVSSIFGPQSNSISSHVQSECFFTKFFALNPRHYSNIKNKYKFMHPF